MPGPGLDLVGEEELAELTDVINSGRLSRYGPDDDTFPAKVRRFEEAVAERAGVKHALAVNAGTSGLYLALTGLGVGPGDEVIVPGFTFVATMSSVVYARARPVLAEIDETFNLDPADVEARITPRTKAIIAVHMLGNAARITELKSIADRHGLALIEDTAQAFGASFEGKWLGSFGHAGVFSFNEYKTITCGDGGMLITDDTDLYRRAFAMHDQGHSPLRGDVEVGARPDARAQLPHDRGGGSCAARAAGQTRPHPLSTCATTVTWCGRLSRDCPGSTSASYPTEMAIWPPTWW